MILSCLMGSKAGVPALTAPGEGNRKKRGGRNKNMMHQGLTTTTTVTFDSSFKFDVQAFFPRAFFKNTFSSSQQSSTLTTHLLSLSLMWHMVINFMFIVGDLLR